MSKTTLSISKGETHSWSQAKNTDYSNTKAKVDLTQQSALYGGILGEVTGALIGALTGALTMNLTGTLLGFTAGIMLGALAGLIIGLIVSRVAGTSGGASIGAYSGMASGAALGVVTGLLIPESLRMSAKTLPPLLNVLLSSRFETVALFGFLLCILGAMVGVWVGGRNYRHQK
jgi:hypothetical protein